MAIPQPLFARRFDLLVTRSSQSQTRVAWMKRVPLDRSGGGLEIRRRIEVGDFTNSEEAVLQVPLEQQARL